MNSLGPNAENLLPEIEKLLEPFDFDYQGEILRKAIFRIPARRAVYEAKIEKDNALGELEIAVDSSDLSLRDQTRYYRKLRRILLRRIGRAIKMKKQEEKRNAR